MKAVQSFFRDGEYMIAGPRPKMFDGSREPHILVNNPTPLRELTCVRKGQNLRSTSGYEISLVAATSLFINQERPITRCSKEIKKTKVPTCWDTIDTGRYALAVHGEHKAGSCVRVWPNIILKI